MDFAIKPINYFDHMFVSSEYGYNSRTFLY